MEIVFLPNKQKKTKEEKARTSFRERQETVIKRPVLKIEVAGTGNTHAQSSATSGWEEPGRAATALRTSGRPGPGPPLPPSGREECVGLGNGSPQNRILGNLLFRQEEATYRRTLLNKHLLLGKSNNQMIQKNELSRRAVFLLKQQNQPRIHFSGLCYSPVAR